MGPSWPVGPLGARPLKLAIMTSVTCMIYYSSWAQMGPVRSTWPWHDDILMVDVLWRRNCHPPNSCLSPFLSISHTMLATNCSFFFKYRFSPAGNSLFWGFFPNRTQGFHPSHLLLCPFFVFCAATGDVLGFAIFHRRLQHILLRDAHFRYFLLQYHHSFHPGCVCCKSQELPTFSIQD